MLNGKAGSAAIERLEEVISVAGSAIDEAAGLVTQLASGDGGPISSVSPFVFQVSIFVMAVFIGYYVVWSVTPALHTPLMSITNAISSVIVVGGIIALGSGSHFSIELLWTRIFGFISVVLAMVNIFGGFLVTHRMLVMYKFKSKL